MLFLKKLSVIYEPKQYAQIEQLEREYHECIKTESDRLLYELNKNKHINLTLSMSKPRGPDSRYEKRDLRVAIQLLKFKVNFAEQELFEIRESEEYKTINIIDDWDNYFERTKAKLIEEIEYLKKDTLKISVKATFTRCSLMGISI